MSYYLERIQRGVDFVETRLDEDIALHAIAKAAGISQWHFQRMFRALTGETLKAYIRARRLAGSLDRLLSTDLGILDISLLAGFESQEAFTRAFKKAFRMTPNQYRRLGRERLFLKKLEFDRAYLEHVNQNVSMTPEIVRQPAMTLVGAKTLFFGVGSEHNDMAEKLPPLWGAFLPRLGEIQHAVWGRCFGVIRQEREDDDRLEYHAAMEVTSVAALPNGMVSVEIPEATYAKFTHRGPAKNLDHTVNSRFTTETNTTPPATTRSSTTPSRSRRSRRLSSHRRDRCERAAHAWHGKCRWDSTT
jgi:AraC family transcriptional regulator